MTTDKKIVAICVATYNRPILLKNCIKAIMLLDTPVDYRVIIIIVDNDHNESARNTVESLHNTNTFEQYYIVEPERGIASARNRLMEEAIKRQATYIAFIDDDEFPHNSWLNEHIATLNKYNADIVAGPVIPTYETKQNDSIKIESKNATGSIPRNVAAGNVLFKSKIITTTKLTFNTYYNFIGGEDFDFFDRATKLGFSKVWCSEAIIYETIPEDRRTRKYLFFRHFTGAINNVVYYKSKNNTISAWPHFLIKSLGKLLGALLEIFMFLITFKQTRIEKFIVKLASSAGYISGLLNIIVERYRY